MHLNVSLDENNKMANSGANCYMTNNWKSLENITVLSSPVQVGMALQKDGVHLDMAMCKHVGDLSIECDDGHVIQSKCFYNPHASNTIISPQAILDQSDQFIK